MRFFFAFLSLFFILPVFGLAQPLLVVAGLSPYGDLAKQIGGQWVVVKNMAATSGDPHEYEPLPSQLKNLVQAQVYLNSDFPFEQGFLPKLLAENPQIRVVPMNDGLALLGEGEDHANEHEHEHALGGDNLVKGGYDLHTWFSPFYGKIQAGHIYAALVALAPEHQQDFHRNYHKFLDKADALYTKIHQSLLPYRGRTIYAYHGIQAYFALAFGLGYKSLEIDGKEVTVKNLKQWIVMLKAEPSRVIFYTNPSHKQKVQNVADQINARALMVEAYKDTWEGTIENLAQKIVLGFQTVK